MTLLLHFCYLIPHDVITADEPGQRSVQLSEQVYRLKTCIQILFQFQRKPSRDIVFVKDAQMWLRRLVREIQNGLLSLMSNDLNYLSYLNVEKS